MFNNISEDIVKKQLECGNVSEEDKEIYKYGYTLVLGTMVNIILAFIIGLFFNEIFFVLSFLLVFIPLRSYCGGWHAATSFRCTIVSNLIIFCVTLIYTIQWLGDNYLPMVILDVICMFLIILCKPQDSKSKSMSKKEKERCHRIVKMQLSIHLLVIAFMVYIDYCSGVQLFLMIHIVQALLLWCGRWKNEIEKRKVS